MTFNTTMVPNWPDAIRCSTDGSSGGAIFIIHGSSSVPGSLSVYHQIFSGEGRYVIFNSDGTYNFSAGANSQGCLGQSIQQLYSSDKAYNLLTSKTQDSTGATSIVPNWPDAIRCSTDGSSGGAIFIIHGSSSVPGSLSVYHQIFSGEGRYVIFNSDGTYNSSAGANSQGCLGQSIAQLYAANKAYNLLTSKTQDSTGATSIVPNWPDAITCNGASILFIHGASSASGQISWYRQVYSPEDRFVAFNSDGSYNSKGGHDGTTRGCLGQSIAQLYAANKAFNLVTPTTPTPTPTPTQSTNKANCLKLKTLSLGSVGDLDRKNEEIELEITSLNKQLDCGLFIFDIVKNVKDKNININIPCSKGGFVDIRFIERDICNDDMTLKKLECEVTGRSVQLTIQITPDNTATSYTQCISSTKETQVCGDIKVGIVGGSFCYAYQWGKEECGTTQVSETTSEYILVYEVVDQGCDFGATNLQSNEHCYYDHYYPGPTCSTLPTTTSVSGDATTLDCSTAGLLLCTFLVFYN